MADPLKRMTRPTLRMLSVLMDDPTGEHYGLDLAALTGLKSGSVYTILGRLEDRDWLTSDWEELDPVEAGRPRRRYYKLTADGMNMARKALACAPIEVGKWRPGGASA